MFFYNYTPPPELVSTLEWCFGIIAVATACWTIGRTAKDFYDWFKREGK